MLLVEGVGISNILDKADYTQQLYDYDRKELDAYAESIQLVEDLQEQQTQKKAALETMKIEQEDSKAHLEDLLAEAEEESENTDARIAEANDVAAQYLYLIEQQNIAIGELYARQEAERRAAEEAAAAAAAAAAAEAQRQAQMQAAASYTYYDNSYDNSYTASAEAPAETKTYSAPAVGANGVSGQDVVDYALQYVGNSYVWGGTSLTGGADCSGFVQSVYRDMGYNISRTTYTQLNDGVSVSYADAQPGDLINYGSHVAIYMGDGQIVHAANEQLGITTSTNATYQPIVDVRRIIN